MTRLRQLPLLMLVAALIAVSAQLVACGDPEESAWEEATTTNTIEAFEAYLQDYPDGKYEVQARESIEDLRWQEARTANTIEAFEAYLQDYPDGRYEPQARDSIEDLRWQEARQADTASSFQEYLRAYPDGKYSDQAHQRINELEELRWQEVRQADTISSFREYLRAYPDGEYSDQAHQRINELEEELSWQGAADTGTIASYQQYLSSYPSGKFAQQAEQAIASLAEDDSPFLAAQEEGTRQAYETFLDQFPGHRREADALRAIDEITRDMEGQHLVDLIAQGKVEAKPRGAGIQSVSVEIRRLVNHDVTVLIPAATFFVASASVQDMVTTAEKELVLRNDGWQSISLPAVCANLHLDVPESEQGFQVQRSPHQEELERVVKALSTAGRLYQGTRQAAVWIVTDNADYQDLGILVSGPVAGLGSRVIHETEAAQAMKIVDDAGIDITKKAIWHDRNLILQGVEDESLKTWLEQRAS
jgi:outer membrane protein assembly factor BamD (BamD/ComL family)